MQEHAHSSYGERIADVYDEWHDRVDDTPATVSFLADLAGPGPVLELGIGTGRVALPLAARGIEVHGIDASPAMVERLRAKPGGDVLPVRIGDFADVDAPGASYTLVYVVFNTFFALLTQHDQCRCFANVAARLGPTGRFVLEAFVPDVARFDRDERLGVTHIEADQVRLNVSRHDLLQQRVSTAHVALTEHGNRIVPVEIRYAHPSELDLMARLAGFELDARYDGWTHRLPLATSPNLVSVYRRT